MKRIISDKFSLKKDPSPDKAAITILYRKLYDLGIIQSKAMYFNKDRNNVQFILNVDDIIPLQPDIVQISKTIQGGMTAVDNIYINSLTKCKCCGAISPASAMATWRTTDGENYSPNAECSLCFDRNNAEINEIRAAYMTGGFDDSLPVLWGYVIGEEG